MKEEQNSTMYEFETKPFKHQADAFKKHGNTPAWGHFWEQGCGKTKIAIDVCCSLYEKGEIDAVVVLAPNGVHRNWHTEELPKHVPSRLHGKMNAEFWESKKSNNKGYKNQLEYLLKHPGFSWFFMNYDALTTEKGKAFLKRFLIRRKCMYILDESHNIKTPGAKRTKTAIASGKHALYKRILTGTPISQGPFDVYSQVRFLDSEFWKKHGLHNFSMFKMHYGEWLTRRESMTINGYDPGYDTLIRYKNTEELKEILKTISDRITKESAGLDLPPKLYSKRFFEMTPEQKRLYDELKEEFMATLEGGSTVVAELGIVRLLRLQQIVCGYVSTEEDEPIQLISDKNPRLTLLKEITNGLFRPCIIWAKFTKDIDQIMEMLGDKAVRYDGQISDEEAEKSKQLFKDGEVQFFVGNPQKGKEGITMVNAKTVIYYSNSFKLLDRLQSEDRAHRIGQVDQVEYIDIVCPKTVDEQIVGVLREKQDIASQITGDKIKEWL